MVASLGVLGPLEVAVDGQVVPVRAGQQRVVLALLLLRANRVVSMTDLIDRLWSESPPADPRGTVQKYVMRLRRLLAGTDGVEIRTDPEGYRIEVAAGLLDFDRFQELIAQARRLGASGDVASESAVLGAALSLWRGVPPLSNVASEPIQRHEVPWLTEQYFDVLERRIEVNLELGRSTSLVAELTALVRKHPLRERFWAQRMRALAAASRQGEALQAYREVTRLLAEELGVNPGSELQAAHQAVLAGEDTVPGPDDGRLKQPVPRQLPSASSGFVGRHDEVNLVVRGLDAAVTSADSAPVVVVSGTAGVGKTTLAVRVAHQVAPRFPDGQLFADLCGYAPSAPVHVEQVLGQFLRALGMATEAVPLRREDQVLAYRSLLADRQILVVLDNVGAVADVRALLPGTAGCAVLVTSRDELAGLAVSPGAARVQLGALSASEARALLGEGLGQSRVADEEPAAGRLIELCGALPLALRVALAHLVLRPQLSLAEYTTQLAEREPVTMLQVAGDEHANLAAAFDWSYQLLPSAHQRLLRLLSLVPGPDFTADAAAALAGLDLYDAANGLDALAVASLLDRADRRHYRLHDLIRGYAAHRCRSEEPDTARDNARRRLLEHYTTTADTLLQPLTAAARLPRPAPPSRTITPETALAELDDDRPAIVAAIREAAEIGPYDAAYHLTDAIRGYFILRGHPVDWLATADAGLRAAQQAGDDEAIAAMLNGRGSVRMCVGDNERAGVDFEAALEIYERIGSPGANIARENLGIIAQIGGELETAIKHYEAALTGYRQDRATIRELRARLNLIDALIDYGDLANAAHEGELLDTTASSPDRPVVLHVMCRLSSLNGDLREFGDQARQATEEAAARGDRRMEHASRLFLAACYLEAGDETPAHHLAEQVMAWSEPNEARLVPGAQLVLAEVSRRAGQTKHAHAWYEKALRAARAVQDRGQECDALVGLADFELAIGAIPPAARHAAEAIDKARGGMLRIRLIHALVVQAGCYRIADNVEHARTAATEALNLARSCHYPFGVALCLADLGEIHHATGNSGDATQLWRQAKTIYARIGSRRADDVAHRLSTHSAPIASTVDLER